MTVSSAPVWQRLSSTKCLIKNREYYCWIKEHVSQILDRDYDALEHMIYESCLVKGDVVERDPKEQGERALLNFGHTIGHSVEKLKNFEWLHGECVALGQRGGGSDF